MSDLLAELAAAVEGLLYPSESDETFVVLSWPATPDQTARLAVEQHAKSELPIVDQAVDEFFGDLAETEDADRYAAVRTLLSGLESVSVFRVGEVQVDIYLIGRCGLDWVVLMTRSIET